MRVGQQECRRELPREANRKPSFSLQEGKYGKSESVSCDLSCTRWVSLTSSMILGSVSSRTDEERFPPPSMSVLGEPPLRKPARTVGFVTSGSVVFPDMRNVPVCGSVVHSIFGPDPLHSPPAQPAPPQPASLPGSSALQTHSLIR